MLRIGDFLTKTAFRRPSDNAVTFADNAFSWAELDERCWRAAAAARSCNVKPGDRIAYLGENSHWLFETYLWPSRLGAISVPLNFRLSLPELIDCAGDCRPSLLIADTQYADQAKALFEACDWIKTLVFTGQKSDMPEHVHYDDWLQTVSETDIAATHPLGSQGDDTVILFYTSGSTGRPKGVMLTHTNMYTNAIGSLAAYGFTDKDTHLISGPLFHLGSGSRVFTAIVTGGQTVMVPRFDVEDVMELIARHKVTTANWVPTMLAMMLDHPRFDSYDLSSLRIAGYGAAPMPPATLARAMNALPGIQFAQSYGMTEASPILTMLHPEDHDTGTADLSKLNSVGRPVPYVDLRIVDEKGNVLAPGETGEIIARGPQIMTGYWNQPTLTEEAIKDGFYHTGDAGYLDEDGYLFLAGRTKEMIITGAENVYPIETENALMRHPAVAQAAVFGIPDEKWGETVHAAIHLKEGQRATVEELIAFCRNEIAHYKCPRSVDIHGAPLPLSPTNKILKSELQKPYLAAS